MTPGELREALERLDVSQTDLGRLMRVDSRSVRRWVSGEHAVPGSVELCLKMMAHFGVTVKATEEIQQSNE